MKKIFLTGSIGYSFWDEDFFTAKDVREQLEGLSGPLMVHLNSGGGVATEGQSIYNALKNYDGEVTIVIDGIAASAASLIAMAGDQIIMPLGSIMMIHDPANWYVEGRGTEQDHLNAAKGLGVIANAYAAVYAARAGMSVEDARAIMQAETYYDGPAAVAAGFATLADEATSAEPAAAFDYRIYDKAPASLRSIGATVPRARGKSSVLAMMAGTTRAKATLGDPVKRKPKTTASRIKAPTASNRAVAIENEEEENLTLEEDEEEEVNLALEEGEEEDENLALEDGEEEEEDETAATAALLRFATARGLPAATTAKYIAAGTPLAEVMAKHPQKGPNMSKPRAPLSRTQVMRDERTTRRAAATEALHAQMSGSRQVSGAARPFMGMSLVEIAANVSGQGSPRMRTFADREDVLMAASHATSDFPAIFQNALNKTLMDRYTEFEPTYRRVARKKNFIDFRPMPLVRAGDFPTLKPVGEGGEIKWGKFGETGETAVIVPYARGLTISRQMMINDELGAISDMLADYGSTIAYFEEQTFYGAALGAKLADNKALFHSDRNNLASGGAAAAINPTSVAAGRAAMRKQKSIDGTALNLSPSVLLVGPDKETEAEMLIAAITPTTAGAVNPFSGKLEAVVTAQITGSEWYLLSDRAPCWVYGYLEGREAPRVRTEEPFGRQGFSMTVEHDFGMGAQDFRGGYKNNGA